MDVLDGVQRIREPLRLVQGSDGAIVIAASDSGRAAPVARALETTQ